MMNPTPAHEFLSEIADVADLIDDVLATPKGNRWHWPSYYLFYAEVDRMAPLLVRTRFLFEPPCAGIGAAPTTEEYVTSANELFALLTRQQRTIIDWLWHMWRNNRGVTTHSAAHQRLGAHVHPKSGWYQTFMDKYCSGFLSADGVTLLRTILPADAGSSPEHIPLAMANCMICLQSFDLGTHEARRSLAHATTEAEIRIGRSLAAMQMLLVEHCTINDLIHPTSRWFRPA